MKTKDFFRQLAASAGIQNVDLDTFLAASAIPDELPDSFNSEVQNKYLTRDRALNDPNIVAELQKKSNKSAYETFDAKLLDFIPFISEDSEAVDKIVKETQTFKKWDALQNTLKTQIDILREKAKTGGKVNQDANKILEEKSNELKTQKESYEKQLKAQEERLNDIFINSKLKEKALSYNFADPYKPLKDSIADLVVGNVKKGYKVVLDDKGAIKLLQQAGESWVEAFEGNEKVTIDKVFEKETKQFIAVSNGLQKEIQKDTYIPEAGDTSKMTLQQMRALQANGVATLPN